MASTTINRCLALAALALPLASPSARAEDPIAALGKQRAAASRLEWQVGSADHPTLGAIRFAMLKSPVATAAGNVTVSSRAFISCQQATRRIAIELANATAPDDPGGLQPKTMPRLACLRAAVSRGVSPVPDDLEASWDVNELGDVLARGLRPARLRQCVAIGVVQEVVLPKGSGRGTARVELELAPYARELDAIFVSCGEATAYGPGAPLAPVPVARTVATPAVAMAPAQAPWKPSRTVASGKTNVRARPSIDAAVVTRLHPGAVLLAQPAGGDWWKVKPSAGPPFEGFIRQDRLVFK